MAPKAKKPAKAKAKAVAKAPADQAADVPVVNMFQAVADELGVADYKLLRATAENLNRREEEEGCALKDAAVAAAAEAGDDEAEATAKGDAAYKRYAFKAKLAKAHAKHLRKAAAAAAAAAARPDDVADPMPHGAGRPDEHVPVIEDTKKAAYQEHIQSAYNRIIGHRVFKDALVLLPSPIQLEEAGDCGVQGVNCNQI